MLRTVILQLYPLKYLTLFSMNLEREKVSRDTRLEVGASLEGLSAVNVAVFTEARSGIPPASTGGRSGSAIINLKTRSGARHRTFMRIKSRMHL